VTRITKPEWSEKEENNIAGDAKGKLLEGEAE
jgi:hypothetical protein